MLDDINLRFNLLLTGTIQQGKTTTCLQIIQKILENNIAEQKNTKVIVFDGKGVFRNIAKNMFDNVYYFSLSNNPEIKNTFRWNPLTSIPPGDNIQDYVSNVLVKLLTETFSLMQGAPNFLKNVLVDVCKSNISFKDLNENLQYKITNIFKDKAQFSICL